MVAKEFGIPIQDVWNMPGNLFAEHVAWIRIEQDAITQGRRRQQGKRRR